MIQNMRNSFMWKFFEELLFYKHLICIHSSFGTQESVRRLSKEVRWPIPNLFGQCLFGTVKEKKIKIRRVIPFVGNSYAPVFYGSFVERNGATVLQGYFAISLFDRIFHGVWLGFCLLFIPLFLAASLFGKVSPSSPTHTRELLLFGLAPIGMLLIFVAFVQLGKWFARNDAAWIEEHMTKVLNEV